MLSRIGDSLQTVIEVSGCPEQHPKGSPISVSTASKHRQFWNLHNGVTAKCDYSESIENFATEREAIEFLKEEFACMPGVLTNRGLVVNWSNHCDEETLSITVRKILIKGKEPKKLPNANDNAIAAHPQPHPQPVD